MTNAFEYKNVVKRFPGFQLGPIDLVLEPGRVLGFIGPNGAGKTTTIQCLVGLLKADCGEMSVFGRRNHLNKPEWKLDIGYVGDAQVFYENWSAAKNLKFIARFYPNWSDALAAELARRFEVPLNKKAKTLSSGNRVKLSLIAALAHSPRLLLLDEPTAGLDPVVRSEALDVLFSVLESGERSIFYSTHILSDISRLADELAFIIDGKIVLRRAKDDLTDNWRKVSFNLDAELPHGNHFINYEKDGREHRLVTSDLQTTLAQLHSLGAMDIHETRLPIDEIAVHILKEHKHVEISKS